MLRPTTTSRLGARARRVTFAVGLLVMLLALAGVLVELARSEKPMGQVLGGTDVSEQDLSRDEQVSMIDEFAPIPTPVEASDIRLRYRRFQDWMFEASFVLPPGALDGYVSRLGPPLPDSPGLDGWERYEGKHIGPHTGGVRVQRATGQVVVHHASA